MWKKKQTNKQNTVVTRRRRRGGHVPADCEILTFTIPTFVPFTYPWMYQFCTQTLNLLKFGAFYHVYNNLLKMHHTSYWAHSPVIKTPIAIATPKFSKRAPKGRAKIQGHIYHVNVRTLPQGVVTRLMLP